MGHFIDNVSVKIQNKKLHNLFDLMNEKPLILVLHRFYGCTIAQYEIERLAEEYRQWKDCPYELAFVVQSDLDEMSKVKQLLDIPIICDLEEVLYSMFAVPKAKSREEMLGGNSLEKVDMAKQAGYVHGIDSGDPFQLPAAFAIAKDGCILYVHYGRNAGDLPTLHDIVKGT
ncbi:redoxin domain-containing protein [Clostridium sp. P21]|uniref:Redoxin domain-containing protein n=1 Tax=Clostridium muellerianum TaxID=2716538 RepID=A0A7Y0EHV0_9CLOT|nr:redoxin domain-containing protein [Clostridium muellerianum]